MFSEFSNQTWTPSAVSVTVEDNTDTSIDGSCKKITWSTATGESVVIGFDSVDLSDYEEISLYIRFKDLICSGDFFTITIGGVDYDFSKNDLRRNMWNHLLFDCHDLTDTSSITITSLVPDLVLMIDYIGYRKVTYDADLDVYVAFKNTISLDYGVSTTLSEAVSSGDLTITLASSSYINDSSVLEITGGGVSEIIELNSKDGDLREALENDYDAGSIVRVLCPVRGEDIDSVEPDPVCGVMIYDRIPDKELQIQKIKDGSKIKEYLGQLGILVYIDCNSKKKLLQLCRQYDQLYGNEFQLMLDGELVEVYLDTSLFADDTIGNNPRMAYYYLLNSQPYLYANKGEITSLTLTYEGTQVSEVV